MGHDGTWPTQLHSSWRASMRDAPEPLVSSCRGAQPAAMGSELILHILLARHALFRQT